MRTHLSRILSIVLLICGLIFAYLAYKEHQPFAEAKVKQNALVTAVTDDMSDNDEDPLNRNIDFEALQSINPDIIGWIYAPQIGVDNPILQGDDDSAYLNLDFEGNYSPLGSIFTWAHADPKLSDSHVCLFGHNMMSGQIFGQLKKFLNVEFRSANDTIYIYTPERSKELHAESTFTCYSNDAVFQDEWGDSEKQTFTLATCNGYEGTPIRLVVNFVVTKEKLML